VQVERHSDTHIEREGREGTTLSLYL